MCSSSRLPLLIGACAALVWLAPPADAAGRGGAAGGSVGGGGGAVFGRGGVGHGPGMAGGRAGRGGFAEARFGQGGYGRGYGTDGLGRRRGAYGYGGFGFGGYGYGYGVGYGFEAGGLSRDVRSGCCEPRYPVALGIRAAPVLPPATYVIDTRGRRGTMRRGGGGPVMADSRDAGFASAVDASRPRLIRVP